MVSRDFIRKIRRVLVFSVGLLALSEAAAVADDAASPLWKKVANWQIRIDVTLHNGCFMVENYKQGDLFRVGFDREHSNGYLMIANGAWQSLVVGTKYPLILQFDNAAPWGGDSVALDMGSTRPLYMNFGNADLMSQLANSKSLSIQYNGTHVASLPLTGASDAVAELMKCQEAEDKLPQRLPSRSKVPPSAEVPAQPSDPFARQ